MQANAIQAALRLLSESLTDIDLTLKLLLTDPAHAQVSLVEAVSRADQRAADASGAKPLSIGALWNMQRLRRCVLLVRVLCVSRLGAIRWGLGSTPELHCSFFLLGADTCAITRYTCALTRYLLNRVVAVCLLRQWPRTPAAPSGDADAACIRWEQVGLQLHLTAITTRCAC